MCCGLFTTVRDLGGGSGGWGGGGGRWGGSGEGSGHILLTSVRIKG